MEGREPMISFFSPVHARGLALSVPLAGAWFLEVRDSEIRQRSAYFLLNHS